MPLLFLDLAQKAPLCNDQPANIRARVVERDRKSGLHPAVHMLDGAALAHGPSGLPAGLLTRWTAWSDNGDDLEAVFTKDDLLIHATIYWATNSIATSMRSNVNANATPGHPPTTAPRPCGPRSASPSSATRTCPASTHPTSEYTRSRPARRAHCSTTSMSTHTADAPLPGKIRTPGLMTYVAPSITADQIRPADLCDDNTREHMPMARRTLGSETEDSLPLRTTPP